MSDRPGLSRLTPVGLDKVAIDDRFWAPRLKVVREKTIPHIYEQCKRTGRIDVWRLDWKPGKKPKPHIFWDSDVAKWIEAASYCLAAKPDPKIEALLDEVIDLIVAAQQPDGYLNSYFIQVEPENRWKNLAMWHELYCAGHLIEAAVAHYQATGKRKLLDALIRYADCIDSYFGPGKHDGCPGHEEIELALVRLYRATGERRYLRLAQFFIDQRGQKPSYFQREMERLPARLAAGHRRFFVRGGRFNSEYCQDHLPVRQQSEAVGHAVRAMYLYCAMADVGVETGDRALIDACLRLWKNLCTKRMYVTGGIGPSGHNEGFTDDYDLPNATAYCETCAAVGLVFWNHRLLQIERDGRFADVMERALYNGTISGLSLDGTRFFYVNPLASDGRHHRQPWFGCACCPPNIARLIASVGRYIYSQGDGEAWVHLYVQSKATLDVGSGKLVLRQKTDYPWDGRVVITVEAERPMSFALNLRIPGWARSAKLSVNGKSVDLGWVVRKGYARIEREWKSGDTVRLSLSMPVERIYAHPAVRDDFGRVALQRGPVVYCLEQVDNPVPLDRIVLPRGGRLTGRYVDDLLGGLGVVTGDAWLIGDSDWGDRLYRNEPPERTKIKIKAIPYFAWDNRSPGQMRVWINSDW